MNTATKEEGRIIEVGESFSRNSERAMPAIPDATPMAMVALAVQRGMDAATIKDLMDLQDRWEKAQAKKAFNEAMAAFKLAPPELRKNKQVRYAMKQGGFTEYKHATLDEVAISIGNALAPHGLKHSWSVVQKDGGMIEVTCTLSHRAGHSESVSLTAGRDDSGSKNNIQGLGSTITYLERYTLLAVTGMAVKDQDDDGRGAGKEEGPEPDAEGKKLLEACASIAALQTAWKKLTVEQRKTLHGVVEECQARIEEADKAAQ